MWIMCSIFFGLLPIILPLIIFGRNYNKVFKKKTFMYLFVINIISLIKLLILIINIKCPSAMICKFHEYNDIIIQYNIIIKKLWLYRTQLIEHQSFSEQLTQLQFQELINQRDKLRAQITDFKL